MPDSTRLHPQLTKIAMSYIKEAGYGSAVADGSIDKWFIPKEPILPKFTQNKTDDSDMIHANGFEFPVNADLYEVVSQDIQIPINFKLSLELAGLLLTSAMGGSTLTGAPTDYVHTMATKSLASVDQFPSTTWMLGFLGDTATYYEVKGVIVNELKITMDTPAILSVTGTAFTDGSLVANADYTWPVTPTVVEHLKGCTVDFLYCAHDGSPASKKQLLRGFEFGINNNLDVADGRAIIPSACVYLSRLRTGKRAYTLTTKVLGHRGDEFWTAWQAKTLLDVTISITYSATRLILIRGTSVTIDNAEEGFDGRDDILDLTWKFFYDHVLFYPISIVVKNSVAGYLQ